MGWGKRSNKNKEDINLKDNFTKVKVAISHQS